MIECNPMTSVFIVLKDLYSETSKRAEIVDTDDCLDDEHVIDNLLLLIPSSTGRVDSGYLWLLWELHTLQETEEDRVLGKLHCNTGFINSIDPINIGLSDSFVPLRQEDFEDGFIVSVPQCV